MARSSYRKRFAVVLIVMVVVMGVTEAAVRARASVLPPPPRWVGPEMALKERQVDRLQSIGGASVVFLGSSHMDVAADPSQIDRDPRGRPVYNAALLAGSVEMLSSWARLVVVPRLRPNVAILGISSREFNPNDLHQQFLNRRFFRAPAVRQLLGTESTLQRAERHLATVSALVKYRAFVRQPKYLPALIGLHPVVQSGDGTDVASDGHYEGWLDKRYPTSGIKAFYREHSLQDFEIGDQQVRAFHDFVSALKQRVKRVIVVKMPETKDYVDAHPRGAADFHAYERMLEREADDLDVELVDLGVWPTKYFGDPSHVNRRGTERVSARFREMIAALN